MRLFEFRKSQYWCLKQCKLFTYSTYRLIFICIFYDIPHEAEWVPMYNHGDTFYVTTGRRESNPGCSQNEMRYGRIWKHHSSITFSVRTSVDTERTGYCMWSYIVFIIIIHWIKIQTCLLFFFFFTKHVFCTDAVTYTSI